MSGIMQSIGAVLLALAIAAFGADVVGAQDSPATQPGSGDSAETELGPIFLLSLGGKLYDDAWTILDQTPPEKQNPALERALSVSPADSWRCVTCHGWDYTGATISGLTFPGLTRLAGADPEQVKKALRDPAHPFPTDKLPSLAIDVLAHFVVAGQYSRQTFLGDDGAAAGDAQSGRDIFEGACISCHQLDGRMYLRGEKGDRSSLGWVARNRPTQALHKILNGVPGAEMLSLRFLSDIQIADLLAYLQTLDPQEK